MLFHQPWWRRTASIALPIALLAAPIAHARSHHGHTHTPPHARSRTQAHQYRFAQRGVLDLADAKQVTGQKKDEIPLDTLDADAAASILAAADHSTDAPGQLPYLDEKDKHARQHERKRIASEHTVVSRREDHLEILAASKTRVGFDDWKQTAQPGRDADAETFFYVGRIGASHYHRVEVQFGQDSPGSFLVNPKSGKTIFVHNGSDAVVLSPKGTWLLSMNPLNAPYLISVSALDRDGPTLQLACAAQSSTAVVATSFRGWHDANSFDVVLNVSQPGKTQPQVLPLRAEYDKEGWKLATSAPDVLKNAGYHCDQ